MVPLVPPGLAGVDVFTCPDDFIAVNSVHLCGSKLNDGSVSQNFNENAPVTEYGAGPIVIPFQSNEAVVGRGFKLIYYQEACDWWLPLILRIVLFILFIQLSINFNEIQDT